MAATKTAQRRSAAEEVCWSLMLMMTFGGLDIPMHEREFLGEPMKEWARLAVETGVLREENES